MISKGDKSRRKSTRAYTTPTQSPVSLRNMRNEELHDIIQIKSNTPEV